MSKWKVGDRVVVRLLFESSLYAPVLTRFASLSQANFTQAQLAGEYDAAYIPSALGAQAQGMLTQYRILEDYGLVRTPTHLSHEEAATLPCAATTAWNAL